MPLYTLETNNEYNPTNWQTGDVITAQKLNKIENELHIPSVRIIGDYNDQTGIWSYEFENDTVAWNALKNRNGGQVWVEKKGRNNTIIDQEGLWNVKITQVQRDQYGNYDYLLTLWFITLYSQTKELQPAIITYTTELTNWSNEEQTPTFSEMTVTRYSLAAPEPL